VASSSGKKPIRRKWELSTIIWLILIILFAIIMLWAFFKEAKDEEEFQKHKESEHNLPK
jgi:uncharacterized protein YpmS